MKYFFTCICFLVLVGCSDSSQEAVEGTASSVVDSSIVDSYVEGRHFRVLSDPLSETSNQNIVSEFFWYGCSHCQAFDQPLHAWLATKPGVELVQIPAIWNDAMILHAKLYYMKDKVVDAAALHAELFTVVMEVRAEADITKQTETFRQLFIKYGMAADDFDLQINSPDVVEAVANAQVLMAKAQVSSTPTVVINNSRVILLDEITSLSQIFEVADFLLDAK
ncbi:thiol:disulfide interchange protein DsbA/DsbL [bacterium]|nr:thiol:disulfide interchange protein DsbA/DsbL [bacterium]